MYNLKFAKINKNVSQKFHQPRGTPDKQPKPEKSASPQTSHRRRKRVMPQMRRTLLFIGKVGNCKNKMGKQKTVFFGVFWRKKTHFVYPPPKVG